MRPCASSNHIAGLPYTVHAAPWLVSRKASVCCPVASLIRGPSVAVNCRMRHQRFAHTSDQALRSVLPAMTGATKNGPQNGNATLTRDGAVPVAAIRSERVFGQARL